MVKVIRIVPQFIHTHDGILFSPHDDPHISHVDMRRFEQGAPIKGRGADAFSVFRLWVEGVPF